MAVAVAHGNGCCSHPASHSRLACALATKPAASAAVSSKHGRRSRPMATTQASQARRQDGPAARQIQLAIGSSVRVHRSADVCSLLQVGEWVMFTLLDHDESLLVCKVLTVGVAPPWHPQSEIQIDDWLSDDYVEDAVYSNVAGGTFIRWSPARRSFVCTHVRCWR